jgi:hypothetical protein
MRSYGSFRWVNAEEISNVPLGSRTLKKYLYILLAIIPVLGNIADLGR